MNELHGFFYFINSIFNKEFNITLITRNHKNRNFNILTKKFIQIPNCKFDIRKLILNIIAIKLQFLLKIVVSILIIY